MRPDARRSAPREDLGDYADPSWGAPDRSRGRPAAEPPWDDRRFTGDYTGGPARPAAPARRSVPPPAGPRAGHRRADPNQPAWRRDDEPDLDARRDDLVQVVPVRRLLSLAIAGFSALLTVGLVFGAQTTRLSYAIVVFGVQALFVLAWTMASRPPAPRVVAAVGLGVSAAADVGAVWTNPPSLTPLAWATVGGFIAGVVGQLLRPAGRQRVTESLSSTLVVVVGVVSFATLVVLTRYGGGTQALVACLVAAGTALVVARLADVLLPYPRLAPQVPRGGVGVVLGAMLGTVAAGFTGSLLAGLTGERAAIAGVVTAVVAVVVDLSVGYSEASRQLAGDPPTLWLARHMQGPLTAFALAAPAAYTASTLLVVHAV